MSYLGGSHDNQGQVETLKGYKHMNRARQQPAISAGHIA